MDVMAATGSISTSTNIVYPLLLGDPGGGTAVKRLFIVSIQPGADLSRHERRREHSSEERALSPETRQVQVPSHHQDGSAVTRHHRTLLYQNSKYFWFANHVLKINEWKCIR